MKTMSIRIDDELDIQVEKYAKENDLSKNQVIKKALRELLLFKKRKQPA